MKTKLFAFLAGILFCSVSCVTAQQKATFVDYDAFRGVIMESLHEAQTEKPYASQEALKENSSKAVESENLGIKGLSAKYKKALNGPDLVAKVKPSVLTICKYKRGFGAYPDFVLVGASAVIISEDGLCVSNYHVFEAMINLGQGSSPQDSLSFVADAEGKTYEIVDVLTYNKAADLAVFKIDPRGDKLTAAPIGDDLVVGSRVHALTHPDQMLYYYSQGVVARNVAYDGNPWANRTEITADYGVGSSGGPIFDDCGNLIAIVSSTQGIYAQNNQGRDLQMVIKMTIPVSSLKKLIY